jgi:hypothetical protein
VHLLDLACQDLAPDHTVTDAGPALRAGQNAAWPVTPCHGGVFHAEYKFGRLVAYATHRAEGAIAARETLERRMARARARGQGTRFSKRLALAWQAEVRRVALADDLRLLSDWLQRDVRALAGPAWDVRRDLFDFLVQALAVRGPLCPHRMGPVRRALERQRDDLLAFAAVLDETSRASSVIENLNSRLRNYLFLRRDIGRDYLDLLRFFPQPPTVPPERPSRTSRPKSRQTPHRPGPSSLARTPRLASLPPEWSPPGRPSPLLPHAESMPSVTQVRPEMNHAEKRHRQRRDYWIGEVEGQAAKGGLGCRHRFFLRSLVLPSVSEAQRPPACRQRSLLAFPAVPTSANAPA